MKMLQTNVFWNTVEDAQQAEGEGVLIAMGLTNWANCMAGNKPPEYFGEMMVVIGQKLGIVPTPDNFSTKSKEWLANHK